MPIKSPTVKATIYLDDDEANTYYAGDTVNGRIEYIFDSPKEVQAIHVELRGEARTSWKKYSKDNSGETTQSSHSGHEEYFETAYNLLGSNSGPAIEVPAGKQVYDFSYALPPEMPSSFEGGEGYVRYTVTATLTGPSKYKHETKLVFTVINDFDLNLDPSNREPIHLQIEKTFCCCCWVSRPLSVDLRAPVSGYCPGQVIPLQLDVENKSFVDVILVKVSLRKVVTYVSPPKHKYDERSTKRKKDVVLTLQEGPAPAGTTKHWELELEIPPMPPSTHLDNCSIIDLDYDLKVECAVPIFHYPLMGKKGVTIGTVPLVGGLPPP